MKQPGPWLSVVSPPEAADPELERMFAAARIAVDPTLESRARVTSALAASMARAVPPAAGAPGALLAAQPRAMGGFARWLVVSGALTLGLGYWLGHEVGRAEGHREATQPQGSAPEASELRSARDAIVSGVPAGTPSNAGAPAADAARTNAATVAESAPDDAPLDDSGRRSDRVRLAPGSRRSARATSSMPAGSRQHAKSVEPGAPTSLSFGEVLEQLRRARAQLDAGQATMSLLVLSELDRNAGDLLLEEREATRVLALCAAGQEKAARVVAERLRASSPRSIYAMRLESSCITASVAEDATPHATDAHSTGE
jgi:hypothetical protein